MFTTNLYDKVKNLLRFANFVLLLRILIELQKLQVRITAVRTNEGISNIFNR